MRAEHGLWFTTSLLLLLILPLATLQNQTCYFPNQEVADFDIPCTDFTTSDGFVFCCGSGRSCLPEGICSSASGDPYLSRGSCTDQSWSSPSCPQYCTQCRFTHICHYERKSDYDFRSQQPDWRTCSKLHLSSGSRGRWY